MSILNFLKKDFNDFPKKAIEDPVFRTSSKYITFRRWAAVKGLVLIFLGVFLLNVNLTPLILVFVTIFSAVCFIFIGVIYLLLGIIGLPVFN